MTERDEVLKVLSNLHTANLNAMLVLVQTLEEAGLITAEHYSANLRFYVKQWGPHIGPQASELLGDFADRLEVRDVGGSG